MFGWALFSTGWASGGVFYGPVVDPVIAWAIVAIALAVCCGAIWVVGDRNRQINDDTSPPLSSHETRKAA